MRSRTRNAAWPSLMCHTVGFTPSAASARTPPTPSTISCSIRVVRSPPYRRCAMSRSCSELAARSVSSRYSGTCPTRARHTLTATRPPGERDLDVQLGAGLARDRLDRQVVEVRVVILGLLRALAVDRLAEVALAVEKAHADERQPHVARGLAVIAGEDAEAARVDRQALVQAELGAEVRDRDRSRGATRSRSGAPARCDTCRRRTGPGCSSRGTPDRRRRRRGAPRRCASAAPWDCDRPPPTAPGAAGRRARASRGPSCTRGCSRAPRAVRDGAGRAD